MNRLPLTHRQKRLRPNRPSRPNLFTQSLRGWKSRLWVLSSQLQHLRLKQAMQRRRRLIFASCFLAVFVAIILTALVPGHHLFEVRLIVSQLGFTINEPQSLLLNNIRGVSEVAVKGAYDEPLTLTGEFPDAPFANRSTLDIELPEDFSRIIIRPKTINTQTGNSEIELIDLILTNQTIVEVLRYSPFNRALEIIFDHESPIPSTNPSFLRLFLGGQPLEITLEGYHLPQVGLGDPDGTLPFTFSYLPNIKDRNQRLPLSGTVSVKLPAPKQIDPSEWLWGDLDVTAVTFSDARQTGRSIDDDLLLSTIREGSIRMADKELKLEADQFLLAENPGIQHIRHLQILDNKGIEVRAVGKSSHVQVGLDPRFPIKGIRSNILTQIFPPDIVIAIISFSSAMVAAILSSLIENLLEKQEEKTP